MSYLSTLNIGTRINRSIICGRPWPKFSSHNSLENQIYAWSKIIVEDPCQAVQYQDQTVFEYHRQYVLCLFFRSEHISHLFQLLFVSLFMNLCYPNLNHCNQRKYSYTKYCWLKGNWCIHICLSREDIPPSYAHILYRWVMIIF